MDRTLDSIISFHFVILSILHPSLPTNVLHFFSHSFLRCIQFLTSFFYTSAIIQFQTLIITAHTLHYIQYNVSHDVAGVSELHRLWLYHNMVLDIIGWAPGWSIRPIIKVRKTVPHCYLLSLSILSYHENFFDYLIIIINLIIFHSVS